MGKVNKFKFSTLLMVISTLAACANTNKEDAGADVDYAKIMKSIDESAKVIADAQRVTAESNNAMRAMAMTEQQKQAYSQAMSYIPPNMERPIAMFIRNEELEKAARMLAILTNYDFNVVNPSMRPRTGVLITVESQGRTAHDVARDMGTQAGTAADLIIKPYGPSDTRTSKFGLIEVEYK